MFVPSCFRFLVALQLGFGLAGLARAQQLPEPLPSFEDLLKKLSSQPADACEVGAQDSSDLEFRLFQQANNVVAQRLNENSADSPLTRATEALRSLERQGAQINAGWPDDKRFHFEILDLPPALVVKMTYRNRATFSFFAHVEDGIGNQRVSRWQSFGALDDHSIEKGANGSLWLELFPLSRGPSKQPRFLAKFGFVSCGTGWGVGYYAYQWNAKPFGDLDEFIKLDGNVSKFDVNDDNSEPPSNPEEAFFPIGKLQTNGTLLSLPYCWFSAIDTWNNPSLCAVDTYDISGDRALFAGTAVNRPDVLPVAKAIEYAIAHDYPAVLAYCSSPDIARRMVRDLPPYVSAAANLNISRINPLRKRVELSENPTFRFEVEKRGDRWLVVAFRVD